MSGWHSTLKFEGGRLWVRDEGVEQRDVHLDGQRLAAQAWTPVFPWSQLPLLGPLDFGVR